MNPLIKREMEDKKTIDINLKFEISYWDFEAVIVTAVEGGCNYWMLIDNRKFDKPKGMPTSEYMAKLLWEGKTIDIYDVEEPTELLGKMDRDKIIEQMYHGNTPDLLEKGLFDALDADLLMQRAVMGEEVFG